MLREPDCDKSKSILDSEWNDECIDFTYIVCIQHIPTVDTMRQS